MSEKEIPKDLLALIERAVEFDDDDSIRAVDGLTIFERKFVTEFATTLKPGASARAAGFSAPHAKTLLKNQAIIDAIANIWWETRALEKVSAATVLSELVHIATVDPGEAFDESGALRPVSEMPFNVRHSIASIEVDELWEGYGAERAQVGVTKKIKFNDKLRALELLGKNLSLFADRLHVSGKLTLEDILSQSRDITHEVEVHKQDAARIPGDDKKT
jgi:phage terminase small subunit